MEILRCLWLSTDHCTLLLPFTGIAEVISYQTPNKKLSLPAWILGDITWREMPVPLISLNTLYEFTKNNDNAPSPANTYIAILNRIYDGPINFFGMNLNKLPRMLRIRKKELEYVSASLKPYLLMKVKLRGTEMFIPDIEMLEKAICSIVTN